MENIKDVILFHWDPLCQFLATIKRRTLNNKFIFYNLTIRFLVDKCVNRLVPEFNTESGSIIAYPRLYNRSVYFTKSLFLKNFMQGRKVSKWLSFLVVLSYGIYLFRLCSYPVTGQLNVCCIYTNLSKYVIVPFGYIFFIFMFRWYHDTKMTDTFFYFPIQTSLQCLA